MENLPKHCFYIDLMALFQKMGPVEQKNFVIDCVEVMDAKERRSMFDEAFNKLDPIAALENASLGVVSDAETKEIKYVEDRRKTDEQ